MKYLKGKQGCEPRVPRNTPGTLDIYNFIFLLKI